MINEILELKYPDELHKGVVLFNCEWYDPTRPEGTHKDNHYKIIEINHNKRYENLIHLLPLKMQDKYIIYHTLEMQI